MLKSKYQSLLSGLLATVTLCLSLCACGGGDVPIDTTDTTTKTDTQGETIVSETVLDTEAQTQETQIQTQAPVETEAETEFVPEVEIPEQPAPDITNLFKGETETIAYDETFAGVSLSALKANSKLQFVNGSLFQTGELGLTTDNTNWDSVGFKQEITTQTYTFTAKLYTFDNDRGGNYNAVMAGVRVKNANHLFIDSGLWFSFRENTVSAYVKGGFERVISNKLPFSAKDGITLKVVENRENITVYANDLHIATATIAEDTLTLLDSEGGVIGTHSTEHLATDSYGYARTMSHYANGAIGGMALEGETVTPYAPNQAIYAFKPNISYAFEEKIQHLANIPTSVYADTYFADAEMLCQMLGWEMSISGDTLSLVKDDVALTFVANQASVKVGDETYDFPTVVKNGKSFALAVIPFVSMLGYSHVVDGDTLYVVGLENLLTVEAKTMAEERFDLYRDVIYNYEDVECSQVGVGKFEAVDPSERLVGMAYSTWHTNARQWGSKTWDLPLYGSYNSDDPDVIYRHGVMLRDAGVDFVFIDWSNNTEYVPATMSASRPDFRMIEEATDLLFDIWATIPNAPKICIFVGPGHNGPRTIDSGAHQKKVDQVYRDYVTNPDRADMYFHYLDKPLLICYGATPTQYSSTPSKMWDDDRFTVRWMTGYVGQQGSLFNKGNLSSRTYWSWEERGDQTYAIYNGYVEAVTVTAASRSQGKEGDSGYIPAAGRQNGATLKKQFQRACDLGSKFVIVVSWNEWTTGEQPSPEVSKDIEPSVIHGTFYYDLLREQIKKFKGLVSAEDSAQ